MKNSQRHIYIYIISEQAKFSVPHIFIFILIIFHTTEACEIDLDNKTLKHVNGKGRYPLFVDGYGDIIYPVGSRKLTFGKISDG